MSKVWLYENGKYTPFEIIESFFTDMDIEEVQSIREKKRKAERSVEYIALQGSIDLSRDIERIASTILTPKVDVTNVRKHRKVEINKGDINNG